MQIKQIKNSQRQNLKKRKREFVNAQPKIIKNIKLHKFHDFL